MKKLKFNCSFILLNLLSICFSFNAFSGEWVDKYIDKNSGVEVNDAYRYDDGSIVKDSWRWIDDDEDGTFECYFFDNYGRKHKGGTPLGGGFVDKDGKYSPAPSYKVKRWTPTYDEIKNIWDGVYIDTGDSTDKVIALYKIYDLDDYGFTLECTTYPNGKSPEIKTYKLKWLEGKTAAVYYEYRSGELKDYLELSIDATLKIDATVYDDFDRFNMRWIDLKEGDNIKITQDGKIVD